MPSPVLIACSTQNRLITGSMPGIAASTGETWLLGSAPNAVAAPENSLALLTTWAWTSSPITISHSPVRPCSSAISDLSGDEFRARPEFGGLLEHAGGAQHGRLVESAADQLEAKRQPVARQPGRHRDAGQPGQARRHREDV